MNKREKQATNLCIIGAIAFTGMFIYMSLFVPVNTYSLILKGAFLVAMTIFTIVFWYHIRWLKKKYGRIGKQG